MELEQKVVGIDPGIHEGRLAATCCELLWPDVASYEHETNFDNIGKLCRNAAMVIVERPDASCGFGPNRAGNLLRCANLASDLSITLHRKWGVQNVLLVGAELIREYTCDYRKNTRCKADKFIKNWLENFHFPYERKQPKSVLFKPRGVLSTTHKRDAYLAALLGEMMLKNPRTKSRVEAVAT